MMSEEVPLVVEGAKRFDVEASKKELKKVSDTQLEKNTSFAWASRAMAAYELFSETKDLKWYLRACDLEHEALEHGALAKDEGKTVALVEKAIAKYKKGLPEELKLADF